MELLHHDLIYPRSQLYPAQLNPSSKALALEDEFNWVLSIDTMTNFVTVKAKVKYQSERCQVKMSFIHFAKHYMYVVNILCTFNVAAPIFPIL